MTRVDEWEQLGGRLPIGPDGAEVLAARFPAARDLGNPPLLLLHGFPTCSYDWRLVLPALTAERRKRFILALRALDARLLGTAYPDIAAGLFATEPISRRDWISHELRDQTGRLVRLGFKMMRGGYRRLLLYPYRRSI